jgi:AraC-like DNA-binding protein
MKVKLYQPQNPLLSEYIECIYLLTLSPEEQPAKYLTFPIHFMVVTISEKSKTIRKGDNFIIEHCPENTIETTLVCNFNKPVSVEYRGWIKEITIYFKPLGINAFLENDLDSYCRGGFSDFNPFEDFQNAMSRIFSIENDDEKINTLESYWLSKLRGFRHPFLKEILAEMMNEPTLNPSISKLSSKTGISRQTLNKHFDKHLGKTPSQFKKTLRFRNAMARHPRIVGKNKLTEISYSLDYFDQAHMVKDFKSLTGYSPREFFNQVTEMEKGQINWLFL